MITLGSIPILHQNAAIEIRHKVRMIAETLGEDSILATRLATATSEMCREMYRRASAPQIVVELSIDMGVVLLVVIFADRQPLLQSELLTRFFDEVGPSTTADGLFALRAIVHLRPSCLPSESDVIRLKAIMVRKGRDELMAEIQQKNRELQHHQIRLEDTVRERTAQLEQAKEEALAMSMRYYRDQTDKAYRELQKITEYKSQEGDFGDVRLEANNNEFASSEGDILA